MNRLLYYCTLIFSLFSRAHLWLVAGALAAALTYSGTAAVHACLLVWRGPNPYVENDSWTVYSILNLACLIAVPLLNWSGTLRRLGAKAARMRDPKAEHTQGDVSTRTIVIYWAFLVLVGFVCIWQQARYGETDLNREYPDMSKVMCRTGTNGSLLMSPNGTFHRRAIDSSFIQDNGCTNPCDQINIPSIFRQNNDLVLLPHNQALLWNVTLPGDKYQWQEELLTVENRIWSLTWYTLPFVVLQGLIAVMFGRRDPREIRDLIYINLYMEHQYQGTRALCVAQDWSVRLLAGLNYLIAGIVVIFCPPLFVISLVALEVEFWATQPDAEAWYSVGQWGPWAVAIQVVLAALIARYHDDMISWIFIFGRRIWAKLRKPRTHLPNVDHELGEPSTASHSNEVLPSRTSKTENIHATTLPIDQPATGSSLTAPLHHDKPPKESFVHALRRGLYDVYKTCAHPLNQSDEGLIDEVVNFFRWCRDPQSVSRHVVRHPLRPRDMEILRHLNTGGHDGAVTVTGKETGGGDTYGDGRPTSETVVRHADMAYRGRMDSGFWRGGSMAKR